MTLFNFFDFSTFGFRLSTSRGARLFSTFGSQLLTFNFLGGCSGRVPGGSSGRAQLFDFRLSAFDFSTFRLSTFDFSTFRLSTFDFRLSTFDFLGGYSRRVPGALPGRLSTS